ncbi:MAG: hypothetical protein V9E94_07625 [Microthrixaceae bacterium]
MRPEPARVQGRRTIARATGTEDSLEISRTVAESSQTAPSSTGDDPLTAYARFTTSPPGTRMAVWTIGASPITV